MYALSNPPRFDESLEWDQIVYLRDATWADYERLLALRGEKSVPRLTYLKGTLEILSPSRSHEDIKSLIGRLFETFCLVRGIRFSAYGSWTLKSESQKRGAEPDECYVLGPNPKDKATPDIAIEVVWSSGGIDKLEVYRKLGVREVWYWRKGRIGVHALRGDAYEEISRSELVPEMDFDQLLSFLDRPTAYDAIQDYRAALG